MEIKKTMCVQHTNNCQYKCVLYQKCTLQSWHFKVKRAPLNRAGAILFLLLEIMLKAVLAIAKIISHAKLFQALASGTLKIEQYTLFSTCVLNPCIYSTYNTNVKPQFCYACVRTSVYE